MEKFIRIFKSNKKLKFVLVIVITIVCIALIIVLIKNTRNDSIKINEIDKQHADEQLKVNLSNEEINYLKQLGKVKMCVDPDWEPYERINENDIHEGIAADLVGIIAIRTGINLELIKTKDWKESIEASKNHTCDIISFLNKTTERDKWMIFTEPYFTDQNVIITREGHRDITDLASIKNETVVFPEGTSIEERLKKDYPNLKVITVKSEAEAIQMVSDRKADMTIRSITMAAYVIKKEGLFNMRIAGKIPNYFNYFRIGVDKEKPLLRSILDKGVATITPQEVQQVVNRHISIKVQGVTDYKLIIKITGVFSLLFMAGFIWNYQLKKLNMKLAMRQLELLELSNRLSEDIKKRLIIENELLESEEKYRLLTEELNIKNNILNESLMIDKLTGINNRLFFDKRVHEEIEKSNIHGTNLSFIFCDLDKFKNVNDTYGHDIGDEVLINTAENIRRFIRKTDVFARWGGEEFVILMSGTEIEEATIVAEKIRILIEKLVHPIVGQVTISLGVAQRFKGEYLESWFKRVDKALYNSKNQGRNRVSVSLEDKDVKAQRMLMWDSNWECGNKLIDEQHKKLLKIGNELVEVSLKDEGIDRVFENLDMFLKFISEHFSDEEDMLKNIGYTDLELHSDKHRELLLKANKIKEMVKSEELMTSYIYDFLLDEIITNHLLKEDIKFFEYVKNT